MSSKNILAEICQRKEQHVKQKIAEAPLNAVKKLAQQAPAPKGFINSLQKHDFPAIITEIKKASPSKGLIRADFNPVDIAKTYKNHGAACLSVLTDEPYFQGTDDIFKSVRETSDLPMLRKDFMIDPYQIYESRALGADCILLIVAALNDAQLFDMHTLSLDLGMDVLIEIHNQEELDRALKIKNAKMIGVNNRNLKTLNVDVKTSMDLAKNIPDSVHKVAESGLGDHQTLKTLQNHGYSSFLIGESLMRLENIGKALDNLRSAH